VSMRSVKLVAGEPTPTESVYVTPDDHQPPRFVGGVG
jgi:hypothetical protein